MRTITVLGALVLGLGLANEASAQATPDPGGFVWSAACRECHETIHDSWSRTKHARTINRLSSDERQAGSQCVGCHVTGPKEPVLADGTMVNANVQCEACHGAGKAHVEGAKAGNPAPAGLVKKPASALCETCHNDKSPHFRGFYYNALVGLVHKK